MHKIELKRLDTSDKIQSAAYGQIQTPVGKAVIFFGDQGIYYFEFENGSIEKSLVAFKKIWPSVILSNDNSKAQKLVDKIFSVSSPNHFICLVRGSDFQFKVWQALLEIPQGMTTHYEEVAKRIQSIKSCRAVGNAIGANPIAFLIPCHRVLRKSGQLGGYFWGLDIKRKLLAWEKQQYLGEYGKKISI